METKDQLTNLIGLADSLKLPRNWLQTEAEAGRIPCLRVGRKYRFNVVAVRQVLAERAANYSKSELTPSDERYGKPVPLSKLIQDLIRNHPQLREQLNLPANGQEEPGEIDSDE